MPRKKKTIEDNETLSKETEKVQEALLDDLVKEPAKGAEVKEIIVEEAIVEEKPVKKVEKKEAPKAKVEEPKANELKVGDRVKLKSNVETDTLGRRIHNGIRNYTYTVLAVRPDNFVSIECLTYAFLVRKDQIDKV